MIGNERTDELHATMQRQGLRTPLRFTDADVPTIEHRIFGRVWAPQIMGELSALLDHFGWAIQGGWRGQADIDWYLDSTAVRRIRVPRPEDDLVGTPVDFLERRVREYERDLLARARLAGHGRQDGRDLHDLELLAVLRHHGAATRLMDFTRNVWVALWFACREAPDSFGLLVGLNLGRAFGIPDEETLARPYEHRRFLVSEETAPVQAQLVFEFGSNRDAKQARNGAARLRPAGAGGSRLVVRRRGRRFA